MSDETKNPAALAGASRALGNTNGFSPLGVTLYSDEPEFLQASVIIGRRFGMNEVIARTVCTLAGIGGRDA